MLFNKNACKVETDLLLLSGGEDVQACRNIAFLFFLLPWASLIKKAPMSRLLTHFLFYLTLWALEQRPQQSLKCELNTCSCNVPSPPLILILHE